MYKKMRTDFKCKKQHIPRLKSMYESNKDSYALEVDAYTELREFIKEQDEVIKERAERLVYEKDMRSKNLEKTESKLEKLNESYLETKNELVQAEADADEEAINRCKESITEILNDIKAKENEKENHKTIIESESINAICEVCGGIVPVVEGDRRIHEHGSGKMHTEFIHLREKFAELRLKSLEKKKAFENSLSNLNDVIDSSKRDLSESEVSNSGSSCSPRSISQSPSRGRSRYKRSRRSKYTYSSSDSSFYSESSQSRYSSRRRKYSRSRSNSSDSSSQSSNESSMGGDWRRNRQNRWRSRNKKVINQLSDDYENSSISSGSSSTSFPQRRSRKSREHSSYNNPEEKLFEIPLEKSEDKYSDNRKDEIDENKFDSAIKIDLDDNDLGLATEANENELNGSKRFKFDIKTSIDLNRNYIQPNSDKKFLNENTVSEGLSIHDNKDQSVQQELEITDSEEIVPELKKRNAITGSLAIDKSENSIVDKRHKGSKPVLVENCVFIDNRKKKSSKIIQDKRIAKQ
ncbi:MAG: putative RNA-binding protein Luc7-like 1 [Paramarteilia canceri]